MLYMMLADGFEETEMIAPLDILRRAEVSVQTVGVTGKTVTGAHGVAVTADILLCEMNLADAEGVILPGGMPGTLHLQENKTVLAAVEHCIAEDKLVAAICAAPMILGELGLLNGKKATCFPGFEKHLCGATVLTDPVVWDGNIITARGAGAALLFGRELVDYCKGTGIGDALLAQMQTPDYV